MPGGLNNIRGLTCFSEYAPLNGTISEQKWGQPLAKSAESIEELFLSERFIFTSLCDTVMLLGYIVNAGDVLCSFTACCKTCNEL